MTKLLIASIICASAALAAPASARLGSIEKSIDRTATEMPTLARNDTQRPVSFHIPTPKPGPGWPCVR